MIASCTCIITCTVCSVLYPQILCIELSPFNLFLYLLTIDNSYGGVVSDKHL